jgi:hypothetical protein
VIVLIEKKIRYNLLYDFYGGLLTEKQQQVFEMYYQADLSLGEISEVVEISRQAIYDMLKRTETILDEYEKKLSLADKYQKRINVLEQIQEMLEDLRAILNANKIEFAIDKFLQIEGLVKLLKD